MAMLLSGLQKRKSSVAAQLPEDTGWGDVSSGREKRGAHGSGGGGGGGRGVFI